MPIYDINGTSLVSAYDVDGVGIQTAYDIDGNQLMNGTLVSVNDSSTGTASGFVMTSNDNSKNYIMRSMVNFWSTRSYMMQSFVYDYDNHYYYCFNTTTSILKYASDLSYVGTITMPSSAGHCNDAWYYNGKVYFPNLNTSNLYVWDISLNTVSTIPITGIQQPLNGSTREVDAICDTGSKDGSAYLITRDVYTNELVHQSDDKLGVYLYDISTNQATLLAEFPWDCVYCQGAACLDGILYVACNTQTTGSASNYKGLTMKAIRTDTWNLIDELVYSGNVEPEGMDVVPADDTEQLQMGVGHYQTISMATRFTAPYKLVAEL